MSASARARFSIVVPFLNEEKSLPLLKKRIESLPGLPEAWELILVSDGSTDGSVGFAESWAAEEPRVKLLVLTRNFGQQAAISAGLEYSGGEFVGVMDADLQDPPEFLLEMYREARDGGCDIVYHRRASRDASLPKKAAYSLFYTLYGLLAESPIDQEGGDFCVMSRRAVEALCALPERVRFIRGLRAWLGLKSKALAASRPERAAGEVQYSWMRLVTLALNGLTSFSTRPLRVATIIGLLMCLGSLILALLYAVFWILSTPAPRGFTTIVLLILFLSGFQIFMMGIIGEYIGHIFLEVKRRPSYMIDRAVNLPGRPIHPHLP